ncbi:DNA replication and repair protein RadC [Rathayibacter rathayi NCPPB 2980 = VKM Ac-1601]|uniref:DNA repair protein n=3 Tax=Rathayibacter rathayi TaxID=33887 RepID=A0ABD6W629_RATRA|nr:DNA repair protein [Rathayibacter rathayi]SOE05119.1 DNA replication and repair protein RadC [Rathayibacter rathayi NCPPB 2980 = VKM Ac-1601]PPF10775.1 DNA repair protein [Rathayibacter rathayi]PPG67120.1 DNA repair protein [Rathayibacter rathayi]PPG75716.1 DNA repair protein [Rathayibacter rathayi]
MSTDAAAVARGDGRLRSVAGMSFESRRMADLSPEERPRERLRARGPEALTDAETLAVLIGAGVRGANATVVAQRLLARFGGIDAVARAGVNDLMRHRGIGEVAACRLVASFELRRRMNRASRAARVTDAAGLAALVTPLLTARPLETVLAVALAESGAVRDVLTLADGPPAHAELPVSAVLTEVLARGAAGIGLAHSHPGEAVVLLSDRAATRAIEDGAQACGLRFLAHVVVGRDGWVEVPP